MGQRITVGDTTYELRPWSYEDGSRWLFRLSSMVIPAAGVEGEAASMAGLALVLQGANVEDFVDLRKTCEQYTSVVFQKDGAENVVPLASVLTTHMRGRYLDMLAIMKAHLMREYADFFAGLAGVLGGPAKDS